jgi:hypothetical protein
MGGGVEGAGWRLRRAERDGEDPTHRIVEDAFVERPVSHGVDDSPDATIARPRHLEVQTGRERGNPVVHRSPVRDDEAVKTPLVPEDLREQPVILRPVDAVDPVVGAHHRPGVRSCDRGLEGR